MRGEPVISSEMTGKLVTAFQAAARAGAADAAAGARPAGPAVARASSEVLRPDRAAAPATRKSPATLAIAETTVKIHVQHILRKLDLTSRVQAAVFAAPAARRAAGHERPDDS